MTPRVFFTCVLCECTSLGSQTVRSKADRRICSWCDDQLTRTSRRRCRKCGVVKPLPFGSTSHRLWCLECSRASSAARYQANRAQAQAVNRARYYANREHRRAVERAYRLANRDAINAKRRAAYAANPEPRRAHTRAWYARSAGTVARWRDRHPGANAEANKRYRIRRKLAILRGWRAAI